MWTTLLQPSASFRPGINELHEAALLRFRCFALKHFENMDVRSARLLDLNVVKKFPGGFELSAPIITDVLNYRNRSGSGPDSGIVFIWGRPSRMTFKMLAGPLEVNANSKPVFFPKI